MTAHTAWVFDLDGTLTVAQHDFAGLKARLGLPAELDVMAGVAARPETEHAALWAEIDGWEQALGSAASPAAGAAALLSALRARDAHVGVLTRNTRETALRTLAATGLAGFFHPSDVLGRACAPPKPAPDGVFALMQRWRAPANTVAMVGDYVHDLHAARAAKVHAIWVDTEGTGTFTADADQVVRSLSQLG